MRTLRLVILGLLVAAFLSAAALAVDKQGTKGADDDDVTITVKGALHTTADGYAVGSQAVSLGPPWYAASSPLVKGNLGTTVTVTGAADDDDGLSVRTINGTVYRAKGRPPWAGGRKQKSPASSAAACKGKSKAAAKTAKDDEKDEKSSEKADKTGNGPPPWAKAYGHRCKS